MRIKQWYKNLVVFIAIFFSANLLDLEMLQISVLAFISLCLLSSSSYIVNDILDREADRAHDKKKSRPIASGKLSVPVAAVYSMLLLIISLALSWYIGINFFISVLFLLLLMHLYNIYFKTIAFADIALLSTNFMIRAISGALAINVIFSSWLILGTYVLALFLAVGKRLSDLNTLGKTASKYKKVFEIYTPQLLNNFFLLIAAILFMTYSLYSFLGSPIDHLISMATIPIVFFLIFRYYHFSVSNPEILRNPEKVFKDPQMFAGMILWLIIIFIGFYYPAFQTCS